MIFAPRHLAGISFEIRASDMMMRPDFRAAKPEKEALGFVCVHVASVSARAIVCATALASAPESR